MKKGRSKRKRPNAIFRLENRIPPLAIGTLFEIRLYYWSKHSARHSFRKLSIRAIKPKFIHLGLSQQLGTAFHFLFLRRRASWPHCGRNNAEPFCGHIPWKLHSQWLQHPSFVRILFEMGMAFASGDTTRVIEYRFLCWMILSIS